MLKILVLIFLIIVAKCSSYDWKNGINSDKSIDLENKEFTKNLENLLSYNGYGNPDFNENKEKFKMLLKSLGYTNEDQFDVSFDPWSESNRGNANSDGNHGNQNSEGSGGNPDDNDVPLMYRRALKNIERMYPHAPMEILLGILKRNKTLLNHFNREMF